MPTLPHTAPGGNPAVPEDMKEWPQFVVWRLEAGDGKPRKVPYDPKTGRHASSTNSATWGSYAEACTAYAAGGYAGLGFVFTPDDPFCFLDIDNCADGGQWKPYAAALCHTLSAAALETSQSGKGLHAVFRVHDKAALADRKNRWDGREFYTQGRFIAFGLCNWTRPDLPDMDMQVLDFIPRRNVSLSGACDWTQAAPDSSQDADVLRRVQRNDPELPYYTFNRSPPPESKPGFHALYRGEPRIGEIYPDTGSRPFDHSAADLALANALAPYTSGNPAWIERIMNAAPLCQRDKWNRPDYRRRTIEKAVEGYQNTKIVPQGRDFHFTRADQLPEAKQSWLVEKIVPENALALFFGAAGSCKTFGALSLGLSVASSLPWYGHKVRQGAVLYICGEGKSGIRRRIAAWRSTFGGEPDAPFYVSSGAADFPASVPQVVGAIPDGVDPVLVIVDTLARNTSGDENDTKEMGALIKALDDLKDRYGASVLLVHHTGHTEKERARGSSVLKAAMDSEFRFEKDGTNVRFSCTKMKDADEPPMMMFTLLPLPMQGLEMSAVLKMAERVIPKLRPQVREAVNMLDSATSMEEFKERIATLTNTDNPDSKESSRRRIIKDVRESGVILPTWWGSGQ